MFKATVLSVVLATAAHAGGLGTVSVDRLVTTPGFSSAAHIVDLSGDTAVVGAPWEGAGAVYVFARTGSEWVQQAHLTVPDEPSSSQFGEAVSIDGDWVVVGRGSSAEDEVYVFQRTGTIWSESARLTTSDNNPAFGTEVALRGSTLMAGGLGEAVYVFERIGTSWTETYKLEPAQPVISFGNAIGWDGGNTVLIGAPNDGGLGVLAGSAYIFSFDGTSWNEQQQLLPDLPADLDRFGLDVALDGDTALVGSFYDDDTGSNAGAVYVYERSGTVWTQSDKLNFAGSLHYGFGVGLDGDTAIAVSDSDSEIIVYQRAGSTWSEELYLAKNAQSVAIDGTTVIGHDADSGEAIVYELSPTTNAFCFGAEATCPCANDGRPGRGCDNNQITGGVQALLSSFDGPGTSAEIMCAGFPPMFSPAAVLIRSSSTLGSSTAFGDGARCVAAPVVRLGAALASGGRSTHTFGHGAGPGAFHYQAWYRSNPAGFCTPAAYNASSAVTIVWP